MTTGCVTLAASRLLGLDAAPTPRLATDKTTARLSAKRRRIQLPLIVKVGSRVACSFGQTILKCYRGRQAVSMGKPGYTITEL